MDRRLFIKLFSLFSGSMAISTTLSGCAVSSSALPDTRVTFSHGVASGDPTASSIILWSRAVPDDSRPTAQVAWEVATDPSFSHRVRSGKVTANKNRDYTVKVDVQELAPDTRYYYRFLTQHVSSETGQTLTLPTGNVDEVKLAVFSCSNYPAGFFNPYSAAAKDNSIDFVLHLGDYIYEYGGDGYATQRAKEIGRTFEADNNEEILVLADYRNRYAKYRTDEGLKALHQNKPFIVVWDDHEISNDTYKSGAQNHQPEEGDFFARRAAAIQAYYEWLPIRPPMGDTNLAIYRTFQFGDLVSLYMLDTRVIGRDKQLSYDDYRNTQSGEFDTRRFQADLLDEERTIMGNEQRQWLFDELDKSRAIWQVLGQQVLMGKMRFPAEIFSGTPREKIADKIMELAALRRKELAGQPMTSQETDRLQTTMAYNLDAWDGYPAEREAVYEKFKALGKQVVVFSGDTHNGWCNTLVSEQGDNIGVEFATSSVSSPGMEYYLGLDEVTAQKLNAALPLLIRDLTYCNLHQRGYMTAHFTRKNVDIQWLYVDSVFSTDFTIADVHSETYQQDKL